MEAPEEYWIAIEDPDELGAAVDERFDRYNEELEERGRLALFRLALRRYYGEDHAGTGSSALITTDGEQGEVSVIVANHYRSILKTLLSLTTSESLAFKASARDDSAESMTQVELSERIWDFELDRGAEAEYVDAVRRMLIMQEAGMAVLWNPSGGDVIAEEPEQVIGEGGIPETEQGTTVDPETGEPIEGEVPVQEMRAIHAGDLEIFAVSPYNCARDISSGSLRDVQWVILRRPLNRWDLAAEYPDHREAILSAQTIEADDLARGLHRGKKASSSRHDTDRVYVLELYAEESPAIPGGRYARVVNGTTLEHGSLHYDRLPVVLAAPEQVIDRALGASGTADLLGPQEAYDATLSNMVSVSDAYGRGNILAAKGQDVDVEELAGGFALVNYDPVEGAPPPGPMRMPEMSQGDIKLLDTLQSLMQTLSGANDVVRGDPQANLKSGAALALVQAMAVQHNSTLQKSAARLLRDMATRIIETYRTFATSERVIEVTGTNEQRTAQRFTGSDLENVLSVSVELANPLLRTIAGKTEVADKFVDPSRQWPDGPITREQYLAFVTTGRLNHLWRADRSEAIAIREECEALQEGQAVVVLVTDDHASHIREHKALLDGRGRLSLPVPAVESITAHVNEHLAAWVQLTMTNPAMLMATGQQPAPMPMMPPGPEAGPPGGPVPPGAAAPTEPAPPSAPQQAAAIALPEGPEIPGGPQMPQMPVNPGTGERVPTSGGMV